MNKGWIFLIIALEVLMASSVYGSAELSECDYQCLIPYSLGDSGNDFMGHNNEITLGQMLIDAGYPIDLPGDQSQIQVWEATKNVEIEIEYLGGISSYSNNHVFGYYLNHNEDDFVPVFKTAEITGYNSIPLASEGPFTININEGDYVGFAIVMPDQYGGIFYATENALNPEAKDRAIVIDRSDTFLIGFEDFSDWDYQDLVVSVKRTSCQQEEHCGNNITETLFGEQCDNGYLFNGIMCNPPYGETCEWCTNQCTIETEYGKYCGDDEINGPEVCEIGDTQSCEIGGYQGSQDCLNDCLGWSQCHTEEYCGDGIIDGGDVNYLIAYLFESGPAPVPLPEGSNISFQRGDVNKDGFVNIGDVIFLTDYLNRGGPAPDPLELGDVNGNGMVSFGEECDEGQDNGVSCNPEYGGVCSYCSNTCEIEEVKGSYCGDNELQIGHEQCDAGSQNGVECDNSESDCTYCSSSCEVVELKKKNECKTCNTNNKKETQEIVFYCEPNWECSGWSDCLNGAMTRQCKDKNNCVNSYNKPIEKSGCQEALSKPVFIEPESKEGISTWWIWVILALIIIVIILVLVNKW